MDVKEIITINALPVYYVDELNGWQFKKSEVDAIRNVRDLADKMNSSDPNRSLRDIHAATIYEAFNIGISPINIIARTLSCLVCANNKLLADDDDHDFHNQLLARILNVMLAIEEGGNSA